MSLIWSAADRSRCTDLLSTLRLLKPGLWGCALEPFFSLSLPLSLSQPWFQFDLLSGPGSPASPQRSATAPPLITNIDDRFKWWDVSAWSASWSPLDSHTRVSLKDLLAVNVGFPSQACIAVNPDGYRESPSLQIKAHPLWVAWHWSAFFFFF